MEKSWLGGVQGEMRKEDKFLPQCFVQPVKFVQPAIAWDRLCI